MGEINSEIAEYIGDMCVQLREMAGQERMQVLAYLLSQAILEASKYRRDDGQASVRARQNTH
jgi:hypothetical protein